MRYIVAELLHPRATFEVMLEPGRPFPERLLRFLETFLQETATLDAEGTLQCVATARHP